MIPTGLNESERDVRRALEFKAARRPTIQTYLLQNSTPFTREHT